MHAPVVRVIHVSFRSCSDLNFPLRFRSFLISCRLKLVGLTLPSPDDLDELELVLCVGLTLEWPSHPTTAAASLYPGVDGGAGANLRCDGAGSNTRTVTIVVFRFE